MRKSIKIRIIIFDLLINVLSNNKKFDNLFDKKIFDNNLNNQEKSFIYNVCMNTMRFSIHSKKIIEIFTNKNVDKKNYVLLASAITQILLLKTKPYAVVNETVEVAKYVNIYPSFINAVLKKITKNYSTLSKIQISISDFPLWIQKEINKSKIIDLKKFTNTFFCEPSLHIVFKNEHLLKLFRDEHLKSSEKSAFIKSNKKVPEIDGYLKGDWWVQNFSSMLPLSLTTELKYKKILDLCAAPGGKAFQILSKDIDITLNDINKSRIEILKKNLNRLNFKAKITNYNALNFPEINKYDVIILDAPCSSIGTIRSNPEIIFRTQTANISSLNKLQQELLQKSTMLLNSKGIIIYMVCSFFFSETIKPIQIFLEKNKNYSILKYENLNKNLQINNFLDKKGYFLTPPTKYQNYQIDGFFSIQLIKND